MAHWLACVWYVIAEKERLYNDPEFDVGEFIFRFALLVNVHRVNLILRHDAFSCGSRFWSARRNKKSAT